MLLSISALLILSIGFSFQSLVFAQISSTDAKHNFVEDNNGNNFTASFEQVVTNIGQPPMITNISSTESIKLQLSCTNA